MSKPVVAIVGRPNVGKSTLFNALAGSKIAIVQDTPGVTRDRIYADVTWLDKSFTLIDTGGIEPDSNDIILSQMREQAQIAIDTADVILFLTDVRQGMVDADAKVADMLRRSRKPVLLVVNKVDSTAKFMMDVYEFYNLGIGEPIPISSANRQGLGDMLDEIVKHFPQDLDESEEEDIPRIAIVGKPNVGKSSLINRILGEERLIVSDIAGTTRDAVDARVTWEGKDYIFIDTAGLRRKGKIREEIERYSVIRTVTAVERADVAVLVIDAQEGVTEQDARIAGVAHEKGKGMIIAVNKWDAIEKDDKTIYQYTRKIREVLSYMPYAQLVFISAKTGLRVSRLFETLEAVIENQTLRIQTGVLNEILAEAVAMQQPPSDKGKRLKIYYMTQVSVKPPTFVVFVNDKELMHFSYVRYIENKIREAFGFAGTPLKFLIRERSEKNL
ncbi:MAG: ribosome biogenesis GTPase Der [Blautia sp.]|nr:ribosome biogenesis GTPase Der [Blautia sp.]